MSKELLPGTYEAKIVNYGLGMTRGGQPQVEILFSFTDPENDPHEVTWFGTLKEGKGREVTMRALLTCGMTGSDLSKLALGVEGGPLDVDRAVEIALNRETYNGKTFIKVQWINPVGGGVKGGKLKGKMSVQEAKAMLSGLNLEGDLAAIRSEAGTGKTKQSAPKAAESETSNDDDNIGF